MRKSSPALPITFQQSCTMTCKKNLPQVWLQGRKCCHAPLSGRTWGWCNEQAPFLYNRKCRQSRLQSCNRYANTSDKVPEGLWKARPVQVPSKVTGRRACRQDGGDSVPPGRAARALGWGRGGQEGAAEPVRGAEAEGLHGSTRRTLTARRRPAAVGTWGGRAGYAGGCCSCRGRWGQPPPPDLGGAAWRGSAGEFKALGHSHPQ